MLDGLNINSTSVITGFVQQLENIKNNQGINYASMKIGHICPHRSLTCDIHFVASDGRLSMNT